MPEPRKPSKRDRPAPSTEISKPPFEIRLDPGLIKALRALPKKERKSVGELIEKVRVGFGNPHLHQGAGVRALGHGLYECRHGLSLRLTFSAYRRLLYFYMIGDHGEVRRFLKTQ